MPRRCVALRDARSILIFDTHCIAMMYNFTCNINYTSHAIARVSTETCWPKTEPPAGIDAIGIRFLADESRE